MGTNFRNSIHCSNCSIIFERINFTKDNFVFAISLQDEEYKMAYETFKANENNLPIKIRTGNTKTFCLLSDLHLGSLYDASDILEDVYDECEKRGVTAIFCAGDVVNGYDKNHFLSFEDIAELAAEKLPERKNIKFYTISGNHDDSVSYDRSTHILERVEALRNDFFFLGAEVADVTVNKVTMRLCHGTFRTYNDVESRINSIYGEITKSYTPDILVLGHIHKAHYEEIEGTHIFQCASLEESILRKKNFFTTPERSVWFVNIKYDKNGVPLEFIPEKVTFASRDKDVLERKLRTTHGKKHKK